MDISQFLINAQAPDTNTQKQAEAQLRAFEEQNRPLFLYTLSVELANNDKQMIARQLAGLVLKNALYSHEEEKKKQLYQQWFTMDASVRYQIKSIIVQTLSNPVYEIRHTASQVCANIALIELPQNLWPELIDLLLNNMTQSANDPLKQCTLETLGYICEEIDSEVIANRSNVILTAIIQGMRKEEPKDDVRLAACNALFNALEFIKGNFDNDVERNYIMQVVVETTQCGHEDCRVASFECLVKIGSLYYEKIAVYMQNIFNVTLNAIKNDVERVALQAIEFWSTVCDEEIYLLEEAQEAAAASRAPEALCQNFIKGALSYLLPVLTDTLTKQEEDNDDPDAWNISMAGATCLGRIANTVLDDITPVIIPYIVGHINSPDWRFREAATMAFGSILEGPTDSLLQSIDESIPTLLAHMKDQHALVKDTTAWTLGRICQLHPIVITPDKLQAVMQALLEATGDLPAIAANACWAIHNLAEKIFDIHADQPTSPLSPFFRLTLQALLNTTIRDDADEANLRASAYEALNAVFQAAPLDCNPTIVEVLPSLIINFEKTLSIRPLSIDEKEAQDEQQGLLCGVLQVITLKLNQSIIPYADKMMSLYLQVFAAKSASVHEEALMAVGAIANSVESDFEKYMPSFAPFLFLGLRNFEESQVCSVAVGVVGDVARALGSALLPYCDEIITYLLQNLRNSAFDRNVKPPILSACGDIAMAISGEFVKYLGLVMTMLQQACGATVDMGDEEMVYYLNQLREGIFEAFTGILQGLRSDNKAEHFLPFATQVLTFCGTVYSDSTRTEEVTRCLVGVIGDMAHALGGHLKVQLQQEFIRIILDECIQSDTKAISEVAGWSKDLITKL